MNLFEGAADFTWTQGSPHKVQFSSKLELKSASPIVGSSCIVFGLVATRWASCPEPWQAKTGFDGTTRRAPQYQSCRGGSTWVHNVHMSPQYQCYNTQYQSCNTPNLKPQYQSCRGGSGVKKNLTLIKTISPRPAQSLLLRFCFIMWELVYAS